MDLDKALADFPGLSLFNEERDNQDTLTIFETIPMKLPGMNLVYDRSPKFRSLLDCQSDQWLTLMGRVDGRALGFASLSWGPRYVNGEIKNVSYLGDLRVLPVKEASSIWKNFYPILLDYSRENLKIDYHLTAILADNKFAIKALVAENPKRKFKYHPLNSTTMINVLGTKPFMLSKSALKVERISVKDAVKEGLIDFMDREEKKKLFGYDFKHSEWKRRLKSWPLIENFEFFVIRDRNGIRGLSLPWSISPIKRMRVEKMKNALKVLFKGLSLLGLTLPKDGESLKIPYLTHLTFHPEAKNSERAEMVSAFIQETKKLPWAKGAHFISFDDSWNLCSEKFLTPYILQKTQVNLYAVTSVNETIPLEFAGVTLGFEMVLA